MRGVSAEADCSHTLTLHLLPSPYAHIDFLWHLFLSHYSSLVCKVYTFFSISNTKAAKLIGNQIGITQDYGCQQISSKLKFIFKRTECTFINGHEYEPNYYFHIMFGTYFNQLGFFWWMYIHLKFESLTQHMFISLSNYYFNQLNRPL